MAKLPTDMKLLDQIVVLKRELAALRAKAEAYDRLLGPPMDWPDDHRDWLLVNEEDETLELISVYWVDGDFISIVDRGMRRKGEFKGTFYKLNEEVFFDVLESSPELKAGEEQSQAKGHVDE